MGEKDRETNVNFFKQFLDTDVEIILSNSMHYTGKVLSVGEDYVKIKDKFGKIVFIVLDKISSINNKGEENG